MIVRTTTAQIARHCLACFFASRCWVFIEKGHCGHYLARGAKTALRAELVDKSLLYRVQRSVGILQPFNGLHFSRADAVSERGARVIGYAVNRYGTGAALAAVTTNLGARQIQMIAKQVLGRAPEEGESPVILDEYANTSSAGCLIAFHLHHDDFEEGELGVLCSFGAGYSIGSALIRRTSKA